MPASLELHPLHRLWRAFPANVRRHLAARGAAFMAPRIDWPPPAAREGVIVAGEIDRESGLGEGARVMLRALRAIGVSGFPLAAGMALPGKQAAPGAAALPAGAALVLHVNSPWLPAALLRLPRGALRGRRVIGYWAWELPTLPDLWRIGLPFVHEVWVPSRFTAAAMETLLPGRVRVVPHALAISPPEPSALDRAAFGLPRDAVIVLVSFNLASSFERKNPLAAIAAFRAAFGTRTDRLLLLKIGNPVHFPDDFRRLREIVGDAPNIRLETRTLPGPDSHALTAACDIVLSLHRSEGFGLVPAEAMLLGRPVVATDWSGTREFLDESSGVPVSYRLVPARDPRGVFEAPGAVWAEADVGAAAASLVRLADDAALRARIGAAGRELAMRRLGPGPLAEAVRGLGLAVA
ncbi:MAG TPA: glycosyltransferase family 4 protein [Acetobacteraceae bacterium]|nr:glycosyltransferase family 4 protein [Acetobacteraceae bacterium]